MKEILQPNEFVSTHYLTQISVIHRKVEKNEIRRKKIGLYAVLGFVCIGLGLFFSERTAFADHEFISGALYGASIVLLLHAAYFLGKGFVPKND